MSEPDAWVARVFAALLAGELTQEDLSVRKLSAWLGQSTIGLYHYFGSLDGFLIRVDGAGWRHLLSKLEQSAAEGGTLEDIAIGYVTFARRHPALYWVMVERSFDRAKLRAEGRLRAEASLLGAFGSLLAELGVKGGETSTLLVLAAVHGLASLAAGGRLDLGGAPQADERLREAAAALAQRFTESAPRRRIRKTEATGSR